MTNDEIRRNDQIRRTKPAIAQLGAFGHSGFGFVSSLVIQRFVQIRFMVPMRAKNSVGALHEPGVPERGSVTRRTWGCSNVLRLTEPRSHRVVRFMVPIHAEKTKEGSLSMNLPSPVSCRCEVRTATGPRSQRVARASTPGKSPTPWFLRGRCGRGPPAVRA